MIFRSFNLLLLLMMVQVVPAQTISRDYLIFLTNKWTGERFPDGRPKVSDDIVDRFRDVNIEEAWGVLRNEGYFNQFEGGWQMVHQDVPVVGRALTAQYMPDRPDVSDQIKMKGKQDGRIGSPNSWPIDMLSKRDVYIADGFGKVNEGTLIGDNLGNSIYTKSGNGVVFDAGARDLDGLSKIAGFNAFVRGFHPSFIHEVMLTGLNVPIRVGSVTVLPGDIVLAKREGVLIIPAHMAQQVLEISEVIQLRDRFAISRLKEGKYTPGQIDTKWTEAIENDFFAWLDTLGKIPISKTRIKEIFMKRTW